MPRITRYDDYEDAAEQAQQLRAALDAIAEDYDAVATLDRRDRAMREAAETRDGDGDGVYCETLPCPCSAEWQAQQHGGSSAPVSAGPAPADPARSSCTLPRTVVEVGISRTRYPAVLDHMKTAVKAGCRG